MPRCTSINPSSDSRKKKRIEKKTVPSHHQCYYTWWCVVPPAPVDIHTITTTTVALWTAFRYLHSINKYTVGSYGSSAAPIPTNQATTKSAANEFKAAHDHYTLLPRLTDRPKPIPQSQSSSSTSSWSVRDETRKRTGLLQVAITHYSDCSPTLHCHTHSPRSRSGLTTPALGRHPTTPHMSFSSKLKPS